MLGAFKLSGLMLLQVALSLIVTFGISLPIIYRTLKYFVSTHLNVRGPAARK